MTIQRDPDNWHKSSYSGGSDNCLEVADNEHVVLVRDSKDKEGGQLRFSLKGWGGLLDAVRAM